MFKAYEMRKLQIMNNLQFLMPDIYEKLILKAPYFFSII